MGLFPRHVIVDWLVTWRMSFFVFFYSPKPHDGHQNPMIMSTFPSSIQLQGHESCFDKDIKGNDHNWDHWYKVVEPSTFNKTRRFSSFIRQWHLTLMMAIYCTTLWSEMAMESKAWWIFAWRRCRSNTFSHSMSA